MFLRYLPWILRMNRPGKNVPIKSEYIYHFLYSKSFLFFSSLGVHASFLIVGCTQFHTFHIFIRFDRVVKVENVIWKCESGRQGHCWRMSSTWKTTDDIATNEVSFMHLIQCSALCKYIQYLNMHHTLIINEAYVCVVSLMN